VQAIQPGGVHAYHQFSVVLDPDVDRDRVLQALARQGIQTAIHYPIPLHRQPVFAGTDVSLPVSEETARHIFSLPVHQYLDDADMDRVADALATALPS
jgi:dTDP-4-amino-4,6-dideoxygalactose transaminase